MLSIQKPQISILTLAILIISVICLLQIGLRYVMHFSGSKRFIFPGLPFYLITRIRPQGISKTGQHPSIFYENLHLSLSFSLPIWIWDWLICPRHYWKSVAQPGCKFIKFYRISCFQPSHKHVPFLYCAVIFSLADS